MDCATARELLRGSRGRGEFAASAGLCGKDEFISLADNALDVPLQPRCSASANDCPNRPLFVLIVAASVQAVYITTVVPHYRARQGTQHFDSTRKELHWGTLHNAAMCYESAAMHPRSHRDGGRGGFAKVSILHKFILSR